MSPARRWILNGAGRRSVDKDAVAGVKDRANIIAAARGARKFDAVHAVGLVAGVARLGAMVCSRLKLFRDNGSVSQSFAEYERGQAHTSGINSFLSMTKRWYDGICHQAPPRHLEKRIAEFAKRHNIRDKTIVSQIGGIVHGMARGRLKFAGLIAATGQGGRVEGEDRTVPIVSAFG